MAARSPEVGFVERKAPGVDARIGVAGNNPNQLDWQGSAQCKGTDTEAYFLTDTGMVSDEAREACASCVVKLECLAWALYKDESGTWGGLSERERRKFKSRRVV